MLHVNNPTFCKNHTATCVRCILDTGFATWLQAYTDLDILRSISGVPGGGQAAACGSGRRRPADMLYESTGRARAPWQLQSGIVAAGDGTTTYESGLALGPALEASITAGPQYYWASETLRLKAKLLCSSDWRLPEFAGVSRAYWSACWMLHWWQTALLTCPHAIHLRAGNFTHANVNEDTEKQQTDQNTVHCTQTPTF